MFLLASALTLKAQQSTGYDETHGEDISVARINSIISNLSATQKTRIDLITRQSEKTIGQQLKQLEIVRDSIRMLLDQTEDMSSILFPLYEKEGHLHSSISKQYYSLKLAIDAILTPAQRAELHEYMKNYNQQRHVKRDNPLPPPPQKKAKKAIGRQK